MKIITKCKTIVDGNKITITAELSEKDFVLPVQLVTIGHGVSTNLHHPRHVQISNEALFVKRMPRADLKRKGSAIGWLIDELVDVFVAIDPNLTDAPQFLEHPKENDLSVVINSEIEFTEKWEQSDDGKDWVEFDKDKNGTIPGKLYRCIATNAAGSTISNPVMLK